MLLQEFKEFYSKYGAFDVVPSEDGSGINVYLLWSCSEDQYMNCLKAGAENVDVRLNDDNCTPDEVEVSVFFQNDLVSTEVLKVPHRHISSGELH